MHGLMSIKLITGTLHEDVRKYMLISRWILLIMGNILTKISKEIKTHSNYQ
jgi:hypothetical protein